jgi:hypothetical protein
MVAGFAEVAERKEILVAGACNHPNCLVLPFCFPVVRVAAQSSGSCHDIPLPFRQIMSRILTIFVSLKPCYPSPCVGLPLPSLSVHPHHQEPQTQRYFCDRGSREIKEDPGL